jgi:hypothetical protein
MSKNLLPVLAGLFLLHYLAGFAEVSAVSDKDVLDARRGALITPGCDAYGETPLTVACRVRLFGHQHFNILVAHETKASAEHWELFTTPGDGILHAYLPGRVPDHVHTSVRITDDTWRQVVMVLEAHRVRLYVDGALAADQAVAHTGGERVPGALAVGALVEGGAGCAGLVDVVRISADASADDTAQLPDTPPDKATLALWRFQADNVGADLSGYERHGQLRPSGSAFTDEGVEIPGGMTTAFQSLPEAEDVSQPRAELAALAARLQLHDLTAAHVPDNVLRQWRHDFRWEGQKEHPESRPGGTDPEKLRRETYDLHALACESDGGPLGAVLRRTDAMLPRLDSAAAAKAAASLATLRTAMTDEAITPDSPDYATYYLAACAVRRQAMFSDPLLDFDAIVCAVRGTFEGSVRSNPSTLDVQGGHFVTQYFGFNALPGGGLYIIRNFKGNPEIVNVLADSVVQNGRLKGRKLEYGAFATPVLSYDGNTIAFAWTENAEHRWVYSRRTCFHIFTVNVDGSNLVQLTDGAYNDFDPCWLPDGRIAFVSERRGGYIRCFDAYLKVRSYTLFSMRDDGGDIRPLSFFETSEWNPSVNNEGQLVYTRWDYVDRENCLGTRFWISNPDGSNPRAPHGNYPHPYHTFPDHTPWRVDENGREWDSRFGAPLVEMGIRAVPDSPLYIFTAAPHHGSVYGSLCTLDLRVEDDGHTSQIKRITPYEPFPETEMPGRRHYRYGTPWPLSEDLYLCNEWENLVLLDRFGNKELICDLRAMPCAPDERMRIINPVPLRARPCPAVRPAAVGAPADKAPATVAVMDVYNSDLPFPEGVKIKWLRVVQNVLKSNHAMGVPMIGYERENTPRIPLGIVPVEEDGSAYFEAPVAKQLIFQALDENFMAVQSMRSSAHVLPGEQLVCLGCHEKPHEAAQRESAPLAMRRPPSRLEPECGPVEPVSYYRQIKPIFEQRCLPCHIEKDAPLQDMSYENLKEEYTFWFSGAMFTDMITAYSGVHGGSRTIPGRFGARASKIGQALLSEAHRDAVSAEDRHQIIQWLDCNSLRLGAYMREAEQMQGALVWPALDVDPENITGVEGIEPGLRRNFWHENTYGPHPLLIADQENDRIAMLDRDGAVAWSYALTQPRDAWMLSNGNILAACARGVREITLGGDILWEYVPAGGESVSGCQPLPDGNVLVGLASAARLVEVNANGDAVTVLHLPSAAQHPDAGALCCRKTPQGGYLVAFSEEGIVREYGADGALLREFPRLAAPVGVERLENGNTLISAGGRIAEYDANNAIVWELLPHEIPDIEIGVFTGVHRLANNNTLVCNWNTRDTEEKDGAHIFELAPDKRVVWQVVGAHIGKVAQARILPEDFGVIAAR